MSPDVGGGATEHPRRSVGVRSFDLGGGERLIYLPSCRNAIALNDSAALIFELCDGRRSAAEIARELELRTGEPPGTFDAPVAQTLDGLAAAGLVHSGDRTNGHGRTVAIGFGGYVVAVESDAAPVLDAVRHRFRHMLRPCGEPVASVRVRKSADAYDVFRDSRQVRHERVLQEAARHVEGEVLAALVECRSDLLWVHAGAVARSGRALLAVAAAGQGKSTITTALLERGFHYLSDEAAALGGSPLAVHPVPLLPRVRTSAHPELAPEDVHSIEKREVAVPAEQVSSDPVPLAAVLLPRYSPRERAALVPCAPAEAALALVQNCQSFERGAEIALATTARLAQRTPAFHLTYRSAKEAADLAEQALAAV